MPGLSSFGIEMSPLTKRDQFCHLQQRQAEVGPVEGLVVALGVRLCAEQKTAARVGSLRDGLLAKCGPHPTTDRLATVKNAKSRQSERVLGRSHQQGE